MVKTGMTRLATMQLSDGGWGWFSGSGETSSAHLTATIVHGLALAKQAGFEPTARVLERGGDWLQNYEAGQLRMLKNAPTTTAPYKTQADNMDALVHMVLLELGRGDAEMRELLYRDRERLSVYGKAVSGVIFEQVKDREKLATILKNLEQYLVRDPENQTAYLDLGGDNQWWYWYGSEYEAQAYYLKLLSRVNPKGEVTPELVKYLLNNRKNATYWKSTRDTAIVLEAFSEYLARSGEGQETDLSLTVLLDGRMQKEVKINKENLFTFDNKLVLEGEALSSGERSLEIKKSGKGNLYFNAYLTNFTLEDPIAKAGLEIKVERKYYRLIEEKESELSRGAQGQALQEQTLKYRRELLNNLAELKSGEQVEVELELQSKNDYEYVIVEDMKAAGFEPLEVQSGYNGNPLGAYVEYRDDRAAFFIRTLPRGKRSVSYRLRAEIPGAYSALPAKASAMYAPELKANSDEQKLVVTEEESVRSVP